MVKFPDISEICITYRLFKKQENGKTFYVGKNTKNFNQSSKYSSQFNSLFLFFFHFYLKVMHISKIYFKSQEINPKKFYELILHTSYKKSHV